MQRAPGLQRRLLGLQVLEGEIARAPGREEGGDGEDEDNRDGEPGAAQAASAPPQEEPWPAVQPKQ